MHMLAFGPNWIGSHFPSSLDQLAMTTDKIRIAIAQELGWTERVSGWWKDPDRNREDDGELPPNYPASLDACAEFEKTLTEEEYQQFGLELLKLNHTQRVLSATTLQRCEAYLRVKGKWVEKGSVAV